MTARNLTRGSVKLASAGGRAPEVRVIDSIHEDGAKLVELSGEAITALRAAQPGLRVVPVVYYETARAPRVAIGVSSASVRAIVGPTWTVSVIDRVSRAPVAGVDVIAFTDFAKREGVPARTDAGGVCALSFAVGVVSVERLYAYAPGGYWSALLERVPVSGAATIELRPVRLDESDGLQHYYQPAGDSDGRGVKVGVVDAGVALAHPDLVVSGGENTVPGENAPDFGDNGMEGHGTHVAGIIGARGTRPTGMRGLAPGAELFAYRVFGQGKESASNYSIAKAIDRAIEHGCDVVNLSLGGLVNDVAVDAAIDDALQRGCVVVAAAGNDGRKPLRYPAASPGAIAVTALGRIGTFPVDTIDTAEIAPPYGQDPNDFIALFSNVGSRVALTAPGVGIVSTLPADRYGVMSGTSMACPAVSGLAARLLGQNAALLGAPRDVHRSGTITKFLLASARALQLGPDLEGQGLPR